MGDLVFNGEIIKDIRCIMYQNDQLWNECSLVSIWNAGRFFGLKVPEFKSAEYKRLCIRYKCVKDGCDMKYFHREARRLGMYIVEGTWDLKWIKKNLPVEVSVMSGGIYHSALIVYVHGYKLKLANYYKYRCRWIIWSKLKKGGIDKKTKDFFDDPISFKLRL